MECSKCIVNPGYHTFVRFGDVNDIALIYTAPAKSSDFNEDGTKLENIRRHINHYNMPWIWVFDCKGMGFNHYTELSFNLGLLDILSKNAFLQGVWILRPTIWIQGTIMLLRSISPAPLLQRIQYIDGSPIEIITKIKSQGVAEEYMEWLKLTL